jgi:hypothetical protein
MNGENRDDFDPSWAQLPISRAYTSTSETWNLMTAATFRWDEYGVSEHCVVYLICELVPIRFFGKLFEAGKR